MPRRCYDCLSEAVAVCVIDMYGFEHWFCAECWADEQAFHERLMSLLDEAIKDQEASQCP